MKPNVPQRYVDLVLDGAQFATAELYEFTLRDGTKARFTDLDVSLNVGGFAYTAGALRIEGLRFKITVGFEVDEQEVKISAFPGDELAGAEFFSAIQSGLLDGAYLKRSRGFWASLGGPAYLDYRAVPIYVCPLFTGLVSAIDKIGRTHVELKVKSPLKLLDTEMPRNTFQAPCQWTLYEPGCGAARASFTNTLTVGSASKTAIVVSGGVSPVTGADGIAYYLQGRLVFTSGVNNNLQVFVRDNTATTLYLQYPLAEVPAPGDTMRVSAGCVKTAATCTAKFARFASFRGFPRVPPVAQSI